MFLSSVTHLLCLLRLIGSVARGQTILRIAEAREPDGIDYTGQIRQFSEIGPGGPYFGEGAIFPRPWVCYTRDILTSDPALEWQRPDGTTITRDSADQAFDNQLYSREGDSTRFALYRGPDYNSPSGEYCCVITGTNQRRCVTLIPCPVLNNPANGEVTIDTPANTATYTCNSRYAPSLSSTRTCQSDNNQWSWSGSDVSCQLIICPTLSPPVNGQVNDNDRTVDGVATYSCNSGYNLVGTAITTCQQNGQTGQWSSQPPTCQLVDCGPLSNPLNGQVSAPVTTFGNMATYSCNPGYTLNGPEIRTCQANRMWTFFDSTCDTLCPRETLSNGEVTYSLDNDPPLPGDVATYTCVTGYELTGNMMRTCVEGTGWLGPLPVCNIVDCGALTDPPNGQVDTSSGTTYNQVATYNCSEGYKLVGSPMRTCQANGSWSSTTPVCEFIPLTLGGDTLTNGSVVHISLIREGASALTCHTELITCCREQDNPSGGALGEWRGPDSNLLPENSTNSFYVSRQLSSISLSRGVNSTAPGGVYCCIIPRAGGTITFCVDVQVQTTTETPAAAPCSCGSTAGHSVVIAIIVLAYLTTVVVLVTLLVIKTRQHQKILRTKPPDPLVHNKQQVYETPQVFYEDVSKMDVGGADYTDPPTMELSQCPAYAPNELLTQQRK